MSKSQKNEVESDKKAPEEKKSAQNQSGDVLEMRCTEGLELRDAGEGKPPKIVGYAAVFKKKSERFPGLKIMETIMPGAFAKVLATNPDVMALVNHDANQRLGRTTNGTLTLKEDRKGLYVEITPPDTQVGKDTITDIRSENLTGMSFSFRVGEESWSAEGGTGKDVTELRTIHEFASVQDVGPVTFPAYTDTSVAVRSLDKWRAECEEASAKRSGDRPDIDFYRRQQQLREVESA